MPTVDTSLQQLTTFAIAPTTWLDVLLNFVVAIIYAFLVSVIYRQCRGLNASSTFIQTLYLLTLVICMVMMVILSVRGNAAVAVAFGLVGALSITRFRTIVKDNRDTAFIFLSVAAGMAAGTNRWWIGFTGLSIIGLTLMLLQSAPWRRGRQRVITRVVFRPSTTEKEDTMPDIVNILAQLGTRIDMLHVRTIKLGELIEATYAITLRKNIDAALAIKQLLNLPCVDNVNIYNPEELNEP
jgi:uncharacterized membrane protein YhiD involved in acid resistance